MKVLLINGSPHRLGCTHAALTEVARVLSENGVASDLFWIGNEPIAGCRGCHGCKDSGRCVIDDRVNEFLAMAPDYDGFIFGSAVHYGNVTGPMASFLDRAFFVQWNTKRNIFRLKPGAAVVTTGRSGAASTFEQLNLYFATSEMPIVTSVYWNNLHGHNAEQGVQDEQGMQVMRALGRNMAYLLRCLELGKKAGVPVPEAETPIYTDLIR